MARECKTSAITAIPEITFFFLLEDGYSRLILKAYTGALKTKSSEAVNYTVYIWAGKVSFNLQYVSSASPIFTSEIVDYSRLKHQTREKLFADKALAFFNFVMHLGAFLFLTQHNIFCLHVLSEFSLGCYLERHFWGLASFGLKGRCALNVLLVNKPIRA